MPVMGLMAPNETVPAKTLLNQVRVRPGERPVNTSNYMRQWLPASGLRGACVPLRARGQALSLDAGNHCRM